MKYIDAEKLKDEIERLKNDTMCVEHGWVARDDDSTIAFFFTKPNRACATRDRLYFEDELEEGMIPWVWANKKEQSGECIVLPSTMFPQLTWMDEPIEVELILRPYSK